MPSSPMHALFSVGPFLLQFQCSQYKKYRYGNWVIEKYRYGNWFDGKSALIRTIRTTFCSVSLFDIISDSVIWESAWLRKIGKIRRKRNNLQKWKQNKNKYKAENQGEEENIEKSEYIFEMRGRKTRQVEVARLWQIFVLRHLHLFVVTWASLY